MATTFTALLSCSPPQSLCRLSSSLSHPRLPSLSLSLSPPFYNLSVKYRTGKSETLVFATYDGFKSNVTGKSLSVCSRYIGVSLNWRNRGNLGSNQVNEGHHSLSRRVGVWHVTVTNSIFLAISANSHALFVDGRRWYLRKGIQGKRGRMSFLFCSS